jgi:hypothetical protein
MTQHAFLIYVHFLYCELERYRADLPVRLQGETIVLILDGHTSRWTFEAMIALRAMGLDVIVLPAHCTHLLQAFDVSVASPVKAALIFYLTDLRLDTGDLAELMNPSRQSGWLSEKRRNLVNAFLNAWDRGATRPNIQAGFRKSGIAPLNREVALNNSFARQLTPLEERDFQPPGQNPEDMECALVTGDDRLRVLYEKSRPIFPNLPNKPSGLREQWRALLAWPSPDGRVLSVPAGSLVMKEQPFQDLATRSPKLYAYKLRTGETIWDITTELAGKSPILMIFKDYKKCDEFSSELTRKRVNHEVIHVVLGTAVQKTQQWAKFVTGEIDVCLATRVGLQALPYGFKAFTVYPTVPAPDTFRRSPATGSILVFFEEKKDIEKLAQEVDRKVEFVYLPRREANTVP